MSESLSRLVHDRGAILGCVIILAGVLLAILGPRFAPDDPFALSSQSLAPPSWGHLMGTDSLGRDVFSQIIVGTRVSLLFGLSAAALSLGVGGAIGAIAGYAGGWVDEGLSRIVEIFLMIPTLFLLILVVAILGTHIGFVAMVVGLTIWPANARIMRAQVLSLKNRVFVQAIRGLGAGHFRTLAGHIIPNAVAPMIANVSLQIAYAILTEAALDFLGLGDANLISWGRILQGAQDFVATAPWLVIFPGVTIAVLILGFHLIGDAVNRLLSPDTEALLLA